LKLRRAKESINKIYNKYQSIKNRQSVFRRRRFFGIIFDMDLIQFQRLFNKEPRYRLGQGIKAACGQLALSGAEDDFIKN